MAPFLFHGSAVGWFAGLRPTATSQNKNANWRIGMDWAIIHLSGDGANALTSTAFVIVPACVARTEVKAICVFRGKRILRRRPIVAVVTGITDTVIPPKSRSRQEDACTVFLADEFSTLNTVNRCPLISAVVKQFLDLVKRRHHPRVAPFHMRHVILSISYVVDDILI